MDCRFGSNPVGHRTDKSREVGFSPAIDRSLLGRFSGVEAVQRTVGQFLLVDEPPDLRVEI